MLLNPYRFGPVDVGESAYADAVLAASPVLYWRLGETAGTTVTDSSGNGFSGTYQRDASLTSVAGLLAGDSDKAFYGGASATSPISGLYRLSTPIDPGEDFTLTMVIRPDGVPSGSGGVGIVAMLGGNAGHPELGVLDQGSGKFKLRVNAAGKSNLFNSTTTYAYGTKLHVKLSRSDDLLALRVNGAAQGSVTRVFSSASGFLLVGYGNYASTDGYQNYGAIDEFAAWQEFVSDATTDAHYALA